MAAVAFFGASVASCTVPFIGPFAGTASASTVSKSASRVAELNDSKLAAAERVHELTLRYEADAAAANYLETEAATNRANVLSLRSLYDQTKSRLQQEAVISYMGGAPSLTGTGGTSAASAGEWVSQADQAAYERVAVGDLTETLGRFRLEEATLSTALAGYRRSLQRDLAAEAAVAGSRHQALEQAASLQRAIDKDRAQLAADAAKRRASAGPPVGNGIVKAIAAQMGIAGAATSSLLPGHVLQVAGSPRGTAAIADAATPSTTALSVTTTARTAAVRTTAAPTTTATPTTTTTVAPTTTTTAARMTTTTTTRDPSTTAGPSTAGSTTTTGPTTTIVATTTTTAAPTTTTAATTTALATTTTAAPTTTTSSVPKTTTTTAPVTTTTAPAPTASAGATQTGGPPPPAGGVWLELRECESGDDYQADTGNGFYGAYQFAWSTWTELGYPGRPDDAPYWEQDQAAERLQALQGWGPWPACSAALGL